MSVEMIDNILAWCLLMNFGILIFWVLIFVLAHDWLYKLHSRWFNIAEEKFDTIHYAAMAFYKLSIFLFNLAPYIAMRIII